MPFFVIDEMSCFIYVSHVVYYSPTNPLVATDSKKKSLFVQVSLHILISENLRSQLITLLLLYEKNKLFVAKLAPALLDGRHEVRRRGLILSSWNSPTLLLLRYYWWRLLRRHGGRKPGGNP